MKSAQEIIDTANYNDIFRMLAESTGAQPTNRVLVGYNDGAIEWDETAVLAGEKVRIVYLTDDEDQKIAAETGDWDHVKWADSIVKIEVL